MIVTVKFAGAKKEMDRSFDSRTVLLQFLVSLQETAKVVLFLVRINTFMHAFV